MDPASRGALVMFAFCVGCAPTGPQQRQAPAEVEPPGTAPQRSADAPPLTALVGVIHHDGQRVCDEKGQDSWVNVRPVAGFTPLVVSETHADAVEAAYLKPVIVRGNVQDPPPQPAVRSTGECPMWQMRDDWVVTVEGVRIPRGTPPLPGLFVASVEPFSGLSISGGDPLSVTLSNPFDVPLMDLRITAHYEGCYGKPGGQAKESAHPQPLAPGQTWTLRLPAAIDDARERSYRLDSIEVQAHGEGVAFDFDATPAQLDAPGVECPT